MFFIIESVRVKFLWFGPKLRGVTADISAHLEINKSTFTLLWGQTHSARSFRRHLPPKAFISHLKLQKCFTFKPERKVKGRFSIPWAKWQIKPSLISGLSSMKQLEIFLLPLDGIRSIAGLPRSTRFAGTHLYTWVERDTVTVKCFAQEHNVMSPARARTRTA